MNQFQLNRPDMELVLAAGLDQVLVAADASRLHGLARQLLQLVGDLNAGMNQVSRRNHCSTWC